jgi:hypothetical protein
VNRIAPRSKITRLSPNEIDGGPELALYLGGVCPVRRGRNGQPCADRTLCPRVTRPKLLQRPSCDHLHAHPYDVTNLVTNQGGPRSFCSATSKGYRERCAKSAPNRWRGTQDRTGPNRGGRAPPTKIRNSFAKSPKLFYLCSLDATKEKAECCISSKPLRSPSVETSIGRGAAHQAKAKRETAGEWRRNALKRLSLRSEMVVSRKSRTYKIWYTGGADRARLRLTNREKDKVAEKGALALKSLDAELKSAPPGRFAGIGCEAWSGRPRGGCF